MLKGKSISEIAGVLQADNATKRDLIVPTSFLAFTPAGLLKNKTSGKVLPLTDHAHSQVAQYLRIPQDYYRRMRAEASELLAQNVNRWFELQDPKEQRLLRTQNGMGRAILSDRYLPIDHTNILAALLPELANAGCSVISADVTSRRMYIKAVCKAITGEVKVDDVVEAGVIISNSEIGEGCAEVAPFIHRLICRNGAVINALRSSRRHVGRKHGDVDGVQQLSQRTIALEIASYLSKAQDAVRAALDQTKFDEIVDSMRDATARKITDTEKAMEDVTGRFGLSESESAAVLQQLVAGGDASLYGLVNAVTWHAHEIQDYDRSVELETIGGELLTTNVRGVMA